MTRYAVASLAVFLFLILVVLLAFYAVVNDGVERAAARHVEQESVAALPNPVRRMATLPGARR